MSFVYSHPFTGLSNGLQTINGASGSVGGWVELGRTTLGSAGDNIDVTSLADKRYYFVLYDMIPTGTVNSILRLNADTGSNYAERFSVNGAADGTGTSATSVGLDSGSPTTPVFGIHYWANVSSNEKLGIWHNCQQSTAGAGTAPIRVESVWKHAQTSNPISQFNADNTAGGSYNTNSEMVVLGWDPDDTHTNNFWEELYSGSGDAGMDTGASAFTAKKYLWIQIYLNDMVSGGNVNMVLNGVESSNYANRYSLNGASDATITSRSDNLIHLGQSNETEGFINIFMVNDGSNEKLGIVHDITQQTAGSGTAPSRQEIVIKDDETTQITDVEVRRNTGSWGSNSELRIWGAD